MPFQAFQAFLNYIHNSELACDVNNTSKMIIFAMVLISHLTETFIKQILTSENLSAVYPEKNED